MRLKLLCFAILLPTALLFGGCATTPIDESASAKAMYLEGVHLTRIALWEDAINKFQAIQARYPFGEYATQAHLYLIYSNYRADKPLEAAEEAERFIRENPRHPNVDYAYYMKGLAYFVKPSVVREWFNIDPAREMPADAELSFQNFRILVETFPDSQYAADARQRMIFLRNYIARYQYYVADYYLRRGAYIAALARAKTILEQYQTTPAAPDALRLAITAYQKLGLNDLAQDAEKTFQTSYPNLPLKASHTDGGWFDWLVFWD